MAQARALGNAGGRRPIPGRIVVSARLTGLARNIRSGEDIRQGSLDENPHMFRKVGRLFVIKTRFEAFLIIYALALGAVERGSAYLTRFPGFGGKLLFLACTGAVFMAGAKILDCVRYEQAERKAEEA